MTSLSIFERTTVVIHSVTTLNLYCADYVENKIQFNSIIDKIMKYVCLLPLNIGLFDHEFIVYLDTGRPITNTALCIMIRNYTC